VEHSRLTGFHQPAFLYSLVMKAHSCVASLRVYQPLAAFAARERSAWAAYVESGQSLPGAVAVRREEWRGLARALGLTVGPEREHALVQRVGDTVYVCPLETELRTLQSLVSFCRSMPEEVAGAFVPAGEVERAVEALDRLGREQPQSRSHIQQAVWHVPLHWFALFEGAERRLHPPTGGQPARLTYQTAMSQARARVSRALALLRELMDDAELVDAVEELREWLYGFDQGSLVQLDYAGLTRVMPYEELAGDRSAEEVWEALEALEEGDVHRSSDLYATLLGRWAAVRGRESSN
jgi:hypothetical protein